MRPFPSFNEAEARAPRMSLIRGKHAIFIAGASMRPRRARLGCSHTTNRCVLWQFRLAFERGPATGRELLPLAEANIFTMSKSCMVSTHYNYSSGHGHLSVTAPLEYNSGKPNERNLQPLRPQPPFIRRPSYHSRLPLHLRKAFANAFDRQMNLVGRPDVDKKDVVFSIFHQFAQPRLHFGAAAAGQPALKDGKLQPFAISVHGLEHAPPTPLIANIIGDNVKPLVIHRPKLSAANNGDNLATRRAGTATRAAPAPRASGACSPDNRRSGASFPATDDAQTL